MSGTAVDTPRPLGGGVELREDVPLKARGGGGAGAGGGARGGAAWYGGAACCAGGAGGPRAIPAAFGALTACITLALLTQIYCGDFELVPHGSVSSSAAACSSAGADALKAGGRALDAAAAAALCLAVVAPHRTSLDASGSLLYWEYREARTQQPMLFEWGAAWGAGEARPPRLVAALAYLHARFGALPWERVLAPAIQLASDGFQVSEGLSMVATAAGEVLPVNSNNTAPELAHFLTSVMHNTSAELSAAWDSASLVRSGSPARGLAGEWRLLVGGVRAATVLRAVQAALVPAPDSPDEAQQRVVSALLLEAETGAADTNGTSDDTTGVATGLAAVDRFDTYAALVTGLSKPFGSGAVTAAGWQRDEPHAPLDLAPAVMLDAHVCGSRYVLGAESSAALAQASAALATVGAMSAVERARVGVVAGAGAAGGAALALEASRPPAPPPRALPPPALLNASAPYAAVNLVLQRGDALASHADSRGGGLAYRF